MATDTATLIGRSEKLRVDDIDFDAFRSQPLDDATVRCLRYMHDIEGHTACYLRDVLVTRAHRDPEVTAFLSCWNYEEHWHGEALARVLEAHGEVAGVERLAARRGQLSRLDAWRPVVFTLASALMTHLTTVQMAWGVVNELTTQAGYGRLAAKSGHPVLRVLLHRIMRQEGRHIDFYSTQARTGLAGSRSAQRVTRAALRRFWAPVGSGVMPGDEVRFLVDHLFGDAEGVRAARRIDRHVDRLPGLSALNLVAAAVAEGRQAA
jgi:hypothetical protein